MNTKEKITPINIDNKEKVLMKCLEYFGTWKRHVNTNRKYESHLCISGATFNYLRVMIVGFLKYCRFVFASTNPPKYVCFLHSNQSTLEASFSCTRACNTDNPRDYGKTIMLRELTSNIKFIDNNPIYKGTLTNKETQIATASSVDRALGRSIDERTMAAKTIIRNREQGNHNHNPTFHISIIDNDDITVQGTEENNNYNKKLIEFLARKKITCHFSTILKNKK